MHRLKVAGLGSSQLNKMPLGVYQALMDHKEVYLRTKDHPAVKNLKDLGLVIHSFDWVYEKYNEDFDQVYPAIIEEIKNLLEEKEIIYGVPGHPNVAEKTTQLLRESDIKFDLIGGASFLDDLFASVQVDPVQGFQLLDAFDIRPSDLKLDQHLVVMQVFHPMIAGEVKLTLLEKYPADHQVYMIDEAGGSGEKVEKIPLHEMDYFDGVCNLRSLYVPPLAEDDQVRSFDLLEKRLSCLDDFEKDQESGQEAFHQTMTKLISQDDGEVESLASLLLSLHKEIKRSGQANYFSLEDVLQAANEKLKEEA